MNESPNQTLSSSSPTSTPSSSPNSTNTQLKPSEPSQPPKNQPKTLTTPNFPNMKTEQVKTLDDLSSLSMKLKQFNARSKVLLSQEGLGPKLRQQAQDLKAIKTRIINVNYRIRNLKISVEKELKLSQIKSD